MTLSLPVTATALLPWLLLAAIVLIALVALALGEPMRRDRKLGRQLADVRAAYGSTDVQRMDAPAFSLFLQGVATVGSLLTRSGVLSGKSVTALKGTLAAAGFRGENATSLFVGSKVILIILLPFLGWMAANRLGIAPSPLRIVVVASAIIGLLSPDFVLRSIRKHYLASVEKAIPDALDLLVICAEAGLALEQGMERVAREIRISSAACAAELSITTDELRILADRRTALVNMGRRTGLVNLQRLGGTLVQALQYGTPLSTALRSLAAEMRADALTRFEERASRLPVLMTVPMILFILPCVFLVVAGPAIMNLIATLSQ